MGVICGSTFHRHLLLLILSTVSKEYAEKVREGTYSTLSLDHAVIISQVQMQPACAAATLCIRAQNRPLFGKDCIYMQKTHKLEY